MGTCSNPDGRILCCLAVWLEMQILHYLLLSLQFILVIAPSDQAKPHAKYPQGITGLKSVIVLSRAGTKGIATDSDLL